MFPAPLAVFAHLASGSAKGAGRRRPTNYFKPVNDSVVSKTLPPSPCKVCGSAKHWDRECPHWDEYREARAANQAQVEFDIHPSEEIEYAHAYLDSNKSSFSALSVCVQTSDVRRKKVRIEEIEEEPPCLPCLPRDHPHVLEPADEVDQHEHAHLSELAERIANALRQADESVRNENLQQEQTAEAASASAGAPNAAPPPPSQEPHDTRADAPPAPPRVLRMPKARSHAPGHSTVGIAALNVPVHLGTPDGVAVTAKMDSGADISLISAECLATIPADARPRIRRGLRMNLVQLTNGFHIEGFVQLPVLIQAEDGDWLSFDGEFYVVPGMTSPLLLGEDFQVGYELCVLRNAADGTSVEIPATGHTFQASSSSKSAGRPFNIIGRGAAASFVRAKSHRRNRRQKQRARRAQATPIAHVARDCTIQPHSCRPIPITADFACNTHWFAEKTVLGQADGSCLLTTPTLLDAAHAYVAVSNPSDRPVRMQRGEVLCHLHDPSVYF
ncbi:hypothetical protein FOMPIDRAFT_1118518, partial [Fomitopsis schrenkii]